MSLLKDVDIRRKLLEDLSVKYNCEKETKIVNEMGILHGRSRIDVAVINGIIHGYEIKSESDTLQRLPRQINDYNKVFDRMTIVIQRNFLAEIRKIIPKWWGIILVTQNKESIKLNEIRKGRINPLIDPMALSHLLWKVTYPT